MSERLGDAPIEPQLFRMMNTIAGVLDETFNGEQRPKKTGFILMVFPFEGHEGRANYISNADRADVGEMRRRALENKP